VYPHQVERLTATLEREGFSALVATTAENVFYLTGFRSFNHAIFRSTQMAVWSPRGTALVVPAVDVAPIVADRIPVDHVVTFGGFVSSYADPLGPDEERIRDWAERRLPSPADALAAALEAIGERGGKLGLDESAVTPAAWGRLVARLGSFTVVPASASLLTARRVKSPYEIECLGRALGIAEEAANAVMQTLKPGVTEQEAVAAYNVEVLRHDAALSPSSIAFGERTWMALPPPSERALRPRDLVRFEVGAIFKGYYSSLARNAVMGEPSPRQQAASEAVQAGLEAALDVVKPGITAGQVYEAAMTATRAAGLADFKRGHVGHAIGLEPYERPKLAGGNMTVLEAGEVLRVEIPHLEVGWAGLTLRDTALVTTYGHRALNRSARGLVVLD
jgi:Xaa-Pro aminopeptidase